MSQAEIHSLARPSQVAWRDRIRTLYIHGLLVGALVAYVAAAGPFLLVAGVTFDPGRKLARRVARWLFPALVRHFCRNAGYPLRIDGVPVEWERLGPCIVVANHASSLDVLMLMQLPKGVGDGRVWAKGWPFRRPLLGWLMRLSGHLHVEDFNILPDAAECLREGESLLVFPESSRSRSGRVGRFRDGAFLLAARTGWPIVAVALHGTHACFPPGQGWVWRPRLRIEVVGVLCCGEGGDHGALKREAHRRIKSALEGNSGTEGA
jgi:1-acyl-sn-glycerol-3-phosphate acyltransferase